MSVVVNEVRKGVYLDSVALMRIALAVRDLDGIEEAGLMQATPENKVILAEARVLASEGKAAAAGDVVIALRARDQASAEAALARARSLLDAPKAVGGEAKAWRPRSLHAARLTTPDASLALISVPGAFAAAEARKAIRSGLDAMIFSDNVPLAEEVELKREANMLGRLVMGPDCGTAIIGGMPLGFANVVPAGDIGIIGASGTGIQEVSCLLARQGCGVSHAIGTGGRDLSADVGGITMLAAMDLLDGDPVTRHIVLISKPPSENVLARILARVARSSKPFTICMIGAGSISVPANAQVATTLEAAATLASGCSLYFSEPEQVGQSPRGRRVVRGLLAGGTLCAEAQVVLAQSLKGEAARIPLASNAPVPGVARASAVDRGHVIIDLGADEYTRGRPHPMIEPAVRDAPLAQALREDGVGVVLVDLVLGHGAHPSPAEHIARVLDAAPKDRPMVVGSVTGTDADPQVRSRQVALLEAAGVVVGPSNAAAVRLAARLVSG